MDEADLVVVDEEAEEEDDEHDEGQHPVGTERKALQEVLHEVITVQAAEHEAEAVGAHQDDEA